MGETESDASDLAGRFHYPVPYRIGVGCVAELVAGCRDLGIERPLVVTDPGLLALDWMSPLLESLDSAGLAACVFSEIDANPATHHVTSGVEAARRHRADGCVLIGGGSAMDAGKCIALLADNPGDVLDYEDARLRGPAD